VRLTLLLSFLLLVAACGSADRDNQNSCLEAGCPGNQSCNVTTGVCEARLTLTVTAETGGSVTTSGTGCSGTSCSVVAATVVTLTATAETGYRFTGWGGSCAGESANPLAVTVTVNGTCTAEFVRRFTVTGAPEGVVASAPGDEHALCDGASCVVDAGAEVVLTAPNLAGGYVSGWSGEGCPTAGSQISVVADGDRLCTAAYAEGIAVIGTVTGRPGAVTATSSDPQKACAENQCVVASGGSVVLTRPDDVLRGRWIGWFGDAGCEGTEATVTLVDVTETVACEARFQPRVQAVATLEGPTGSVTIDSNDENDICESGSCWADEGSSFTFEAPNEFADWSFSNWSGDCGDGSETSAQVSDAVTDVTCTAHYAGFLDVIGTPSDPEATIQAQTENGPCGGNSCRVSTGTRVEFYVSGDFDITGVTGQGCENDNNDGVRFIYVEAAFDEQTCAITVQGTVDFQLHASGSGAVEFEESSDDLETFNQGSFARLLGRVGDPVTIRAVPDGSAFEAWSGDDCPIAGSTETSVVWPSVRGSTFDCTATFVGL
jgi:Divergent InlB B-repeat domain